jgi:LuxR family transcriptional regulator, maltose regulon positive regulatory protein
VAIVAAPLAKLTCPRLYHAIRRAHVFKLLDQRKSYPIIWVSGPPGAGKTTAVADYLERRRVRALWYQVDESDRDPATLFLYLAQLVAGGSRKRRQLPSLAPEFLLELLAFARRFFRDFFALCPPGTTLVLDNCQDASSDTFHLILREACAEIPLSANLILISRSTRPRELSRLAATRKVREIGWEDLRLSREETRAMARSLGADSKQSFEALHRRSGGWAAGVVLLTANRADHVDESSNELASEESIFEYFASEILDSSTPTERDFLLKTALFPELTATMATELISGTGAPAMLENLHRRQYFTNRRTERQFIYQYHDLFRDFLLARLADTLGQARLQGLRRRAARILESRGQLSDAVSLFSQSGQWRDAARLIKLYAESLIDQGRWQTVNEWFAPLPQKVVASDPWLLFWRAIGLFTVDLQRAAILLNQAYRGFATQKNAKGQLYAISPLTDLNWLSGDDIRRYGEWLRVLEHHLSGRSKFASVSVGIRAWIAYLQVAMFGKGHGHLLAKGVEWLTQCFLSREVSTDLRLNASDLVLAHCMFTADGERATRLSTVAAHLVENEATSPLSRMWVYKWLGRVALARGEPEVASQYLERAFDLARLCQVPGQMADILWSRIALHYMAGASRDANTAFGEFPAQVAGGVFINAVRHKCIALCHAAAGQFDVALHEEERALLASKKLGSTLMIADCTMMLGIHGLHGKQIQRAINNLKRARHLFSPTIYRHLDALLNLAIAQGYLLSGDQRAAEKWLRRGLDAAQNPLKASHLPWIRRWLPDLLAFALACEIKTELVRALIGRFAVRPQRSALLNWPWPIKIFTLGEFRISKDNVPLATQGRARYKLTELLKALIAAGGKQVNAETITEWLWPDAEGDAAENNLKISLHRLRKFLGRDEAVKLNGGKLSLNDELCWVDAWAFGSAGADGEPADQSRLSAIDLYRGHFMQNDSYAWLLSERERLRSKFLREAVAVGQTLEATHNHRQAASFYSKCLEVDSAAELLYRQLMLCLRANGRNAEAADIYHRCRRVLGDSLGVKPSKETQQVYESLLSDG